MDASPKKMVSYAYYKMQISISSFPTINYFTCLLLVLLSLNPLSPQPQYYHSLAQSTTELSWIQTLLNELQVPFNTPIVLYDNQNVVALAHKPILHARTKHMDIDVFFVQENVLTKYMIVHHVPPGYQNIVQRVTVSYSTLLSQQLGGQLQLVCMLVIDNC